MIAIWTLINGSWIARVMSIAVAALIAWKVNNAIVGRKAVTTFVERSKEEGRKLNDQNAQIRERTKRPGAADRLRNSVCRDC